MEGQFLNASARWSLMDWTSHEDFIGHHSNADQAKVMAWIERQARRTGCREVRRHVFEHNVRAIDFYRRRGFEPNHIFMRKKISSRRFAAR